MDLTSTEVGGTVATTELTNLPSGNRNFTGFVALLPGVVYNPSSDSSSDNVTVNGQHGSGVVFLMDGGSNNDDLRGGSAGAQARTPLEAIQEFQVVTNQFDAAYGGATAGVINAVSKQGTNALRGSAFGYFTNANLTAEDFFVAQQDLEKPDAQRKQWGGTVGGPIVRDKMHFFFSFERSDLDEGRSRVYPTRPDKSFTATQQTNSFNSMLRIDHQINSSVNYAVRGLWDHQPNYNQVLGDGTKDTLYTEKDDDATLVGTFNWITTADPVADPAGVLRPGAARPRHAAVLRGAVVRGPADARLPQLLRPGRQRVRRRPADEGLRVRHLVHVVQARCLGQPRRQDRRCSTSSASTCATTSATPTAASPFRPTSTTTRPIRGPIRNGSPSACPAPARVLSRTNSIGTYVHDKWQVTTGLTLNVGLRYDVHISPLSRTPTTRSSTIPDDYPIDTNNFQPRLGFAYNIGGRSVLRGGYGLFYEKQWIDRFEPYMLNRVFADSFLAMYPFNAADPGPSNGRFPTDPFLVNGPTVNRALLDQLAPPGSVSRNTGDVYLDNADRQLAAQHQLTVGYERQLWQNVSFAADYVHTENRDQPIRYNYNPAVRANTSRTGPIVRVDFLGLADQLGISPFVSNVYTYLNEASSSYDGIAVQLEKRFSGYWGGRISYSIGYARGNTSGLPTAVNDYQVLDDAQLDRNDGPTNFDRRHTLSMSGRLDLPVLHGVTLAATARTMSGSPFSVYDSTTDEDRNGVLTDLLPAGTYTGTGENAIEVESDGRRNGAYGPGFFQLDVRAGYRVRFGGSRTIDFFGEVFNVTNRANFNNPSGDRRSGNFLVPVALRGGGFPRQFQLGARLGF